MNDQELTMKICPFIQLGTLIRCRGNDCMAWQSLGKQDTGDMFRYEDRPEVGYCKLIDRDMG